jgi:K+-transporting ATPase ATPase B chain
MSGVDVDGRQIRKGAADSVKQFVESHGGSMPVDLASAVASTSSS